MTEQTINGIPFPMKELCDFSFLQAYGLGWAKGSGGFSSR